ncbi:hypothetical protein, partial [Hungatella effluvii]|uniref:hypothetical protein n=1 Tax=Hungatella effluvii TaxID=1096246 RepID=UPI0022E74775
EKSCALRIANTLQSHRKQSMSQPGQTGKQGPAGAGNCSWLGQTAKRLAMCWGVWYDKIV